MICVLLVLLLDESLSAPSFCQKHFLQVTCCQVLPVIFIEALKNLDITPLSISVLFFRTNKRFTKFDGWHTHALSFLTRNCLFDKEVKSQLLLSLVMNLKKVAAVTKFTADCFIIRYSFPAETYHCGLHNITIISSSTIILVESWLLSEMTPMISVYYSHHPFVVPVLPASHSIPSCHFSIGLHNFLVSSGLYRKRHFTVRGFHPYNMTSPSKLLTNDLVLQQ